jgi:hypothetical protein
MKLILGLSYAYAISTLSNAKETVEDAGSEMRLLAGAEAADDITACRYFGFQRGSPEI